MPFSQSFANPLVTGEFGLRFYAGAPILTDDGLAVGTVCIVDKQPREFSESDEVLLQYFARIAIQEIQLRYQTLNSIMEV
jgi:GAF domain-containing protein